MSAQTIYHWHHIVPRHAGGSDDPSNLVRLSIEEHAKAHKKLYEKYNRWQDKIAWQCLSGMIEPQEAIAEAQRLGGSEGARRAKEELKGFWSSETQASNARESHIVNKENKKGFFDSKLQSKLGKRGAKASGLGTTNSGNSIRICCLGCGKDTTKPTFVGHHLKKCF